MIVNYQWPKGWRDYVITEGVEDIGLPQYTVKRIKESMPGADPAAMTYVGNLFKASQTMAGFHIYRGRQIAEQLEALMGDLLGYIEDDGPIEKRLDQFNQTLVQFMQKLEFGIQTPSSITGTTVQKSPYRRGMLKKDLKTIAKISKRLSVIIDSLDDTISAKEGPRKRRWKRELPRMMQRLELAQTASEEAIKYTTERFIGNDRIQNLIRLLNFRKDNWKLVQNYYRGGWQKYAIGKTDAEFLLSAMDPNSGDYNPDLRDEDQATRNAARNAIRQQAKEEVEGLAYGRNIKGLKGLPDPLYDTEFSRFVNYQNDLDAEEGKTMMRFDPDDDGIEYYWVDLDTHNCPIEASRMGHCGAAQQGGSIYSLRYKEPGQRLSKSVVTIEYSEDENTVYQIKGRANTIPARQYWPYIVTFLEEAGGPTITESGEHSDEPGSEWNEFLEDVARDSGSDLNSNRELNDLVESIYDGAYDNDYVSFSAELIDYGETYATLQGTANIPFTYKGSLFEDLERPANRTEISEALEMYFDRYEDIFDFDRGGYLTASEYIYTAMSSDNRRRRTISHLGGPNYTIAAPINVGDENYFYSADELKSQIEYLSEDAYDEDAMEELGEKLTLIVDAASPAGMEGRKNVKLLFQELMKFEKESKNLLFELEQDYDWDDYEDLEREMLDDELEMDVWFSEYVPLYTIPMEGEDTSKVSWRGKQVLEGLSHIPLYDGGKSEIISKALEMDKKQQSLPGMPSEVDVDLRKPSTPYFSANLLMGRIGAGQVKYMVKFSIGLDSTTLSFTKQDVAGIMRYFKILDKYIPEAIDSVIADRMKKGKLDDVSDRQLQSLKGSGVEFNPKYFPNDFIKRVDKLMSGEPVTEGHRPKRKIKIRMRRK